MPDTYKESKRIHNKMYDFYEYAIDALNVDLLLFTDFYTLLSISKKYNP